MPTGIEKLANAVESFQRTTRTIGTTLKRTSDLFTEQYGSQGYASDLNAFHPKHKFIFKVVFRFNPEYAELFKMTSRDFSFLVMNIDKPKINFESEEVNHYNFRTKVVKKITHDPLTMTFIDDIKNKVFEFTELYRLCFSPQARRRATEMNTPMVTKDSGMNFSEHRELNVAMNASTASVSPMVGQSVNVLEQIILHQYFDYGVSVNSFHFMNPRILTMDWDDADHANSNGDAINIQFDYDILYTETKRTAETEIPEWGQYEIWRSKNTVGIPLAVPDEVNMGPRLGQIPGLANTPLGKALGGVPIDVLLPGVRKGLTEAGVGSIFQQASRSAATVANSMKLGKELIGGIFGKK